MTDTQQYRTQRLTAMGFAAGSAAVLGLVAPASAFQSESPESINLIGLARDFEEQSASNGHPDFEVMPSAGGGLYSGNLNLRLDRSGRPVFNGQGNLVESDYRDSSGQPIAPHMFNSYWEQDAPIEPDGSAMLNGPGGQSDVFKVTLVSATFNDDGTSTWVYEVQELASGTDISHITFQLYPSHQVVTNGTTPGFDAGEDASSGMYGIKWDLEDDFNQGTFTIVLDGHFEGENSSDGVLIKSGQNVDSGSFFVPSNVPSDFEDPTWKRGNLVSDSGMGDAAGVDGESSAGGIQSAESFEQWYTDYPGVNMSKEVVITLDRQSDGTYVFDDALDPDYMELGGFFPLDDELYGNSGGSPDHNYHFTYELHTQFTYDDSGDQWFRFIGDDDVWVFIDGKLAIDLGGVHSATEQFIDVDRMGLVDGEEYKLDFYFAERHRTESNFRIETNIELESLPIPSVSATFD